MDIKIGETIRRKRTELGITQEELASQLGVTKAAVSKWELAQSVPDVLLIPAIAGFFGITTDELFGYHAETGQPRKIVTRYDTSIRAWDDLIDHSIFDHAVIDSTAIQKCGEPDNLHYSVYAFFHSEEPDFLARLQAAMRDGLILDTVSKVIEDGRISPTEPVYHHWVCKHKIYSFRVGDRAAYKAIVKELLALGLMNEDDLY